MRRLFEGGAYSNKYGISFGITGHNAFTVTSLTKLCILAYSWSFKGWLIFLYGIFSCKYLHCSLNRTKTVLPYVTVFLSAFFFLSEKN